MKTKKAVLAPAALDLETLDQVIGGCRLVAIGTQPQPASATIAPDWSSVGAVSSAGFDQDSLGLSFARSHMDVVSKLAGIDAQHAPMFLDDAHGAKTAVDPRESNGHEFHCGTMQQAPIDAPPEQPVELHCGTTTSTSEDSAPPASWHDDAPSCHDTAPPPSCHENAPPPSCHESAPPPSCHESAPPPSCHESAPPPSCHESAPPPSCHESAPPPELHCGTTPTTTTTTTPPTEAPPSAPMFL